MSRLTKIIEEMIDFEISEVNKYLKGEHVYSKRGRHERWYVAACLTGAIERACGIHAKGIEVGMIRLGHYKKEKKRVAKYWAEVRAGKRTDTRRGFDKEREKQEGDP